MSKARELLDFLNEGLTKAGFDYTEISPDNWKQVLSSVGIKSKPILVQTEDPLFNFKMWKWNGKNIFIVTSYDPLTGKNADKLNKPGDPGFAGYIGIEGESGLVKKVFSLIKKKADHIKGANPKDRDFI